MHPAVTEWVAHTVRTYGPFARVLEIGSRDMNGTVRPLFPDAAQYHGIDLLPGPCVDEVGDFTQRVAGPPDAWDVVVCAEVLEHAENAADLVANALRHLRPGGWFVATMAYTGRGPHSAGEKEGPPLPGEFYRNVTYGDLAGWLWFGGFDRASFELNVAGVDIRCAAQRPA